MTEPIAVRRFLETPDPPARTPVRITNATVRSVTNRVDHDVTGLVVQLVEFWLPDGAAQYLRPGTQWTLVEGVTDHIEPQ